MGRIGGFLLTTLPARPRLSALSQISTVPPVNEIMLPLKNNITPTFNHYLHAFKSESLKALCKTRPQKAKETEDP